MSGEPDVLSADQLRQFQLTKEVLHCIMTISDNIAATRRWPEPDFYRARRVLDDAGISMDAMQESWHLFLLDGIKRIAQAALDGTHLTIAESIELLPLPPGPDIGR